MVIINNSKIVRSYYICVFFKVRNWKNIFLRNFFKRTVYFYLLRSALRNLIFSFAREKNRLLHLAVRVRLNFFKFNYNNITFSDFISKNSIIVNPWIIMKLLLHSIYKATHFTYEYLNTLPCRILSFYSTTRANIFYSDFLANFIRLPYFFNVFDEIIDMTIKLGKKRDFAKEEFNKNTSFNRKLLATQISKTNGNKLSFETLFTDANKMLNLRLFSTEGEKFLLLKASIYYFFLSNSGFFNRVVSNHNFVKNTIIKMMLNVARYKSKPTIRNFWFIILPVIIGLQKFTTFGLDNSDFSFFVSNMIAGRKLVTFLVPLFVSEKSDEKENHDKTINRRIAKE